MCPCKNHQLLYSLEQVVETKGTLGTLATNDANQYVRFPFNSSIQLLRKLNITPGPTALPTTSYLGPPRLMVPTVRTVVLSEEKTLRIDAVALLPGKTTSDFTLDLYSRSLGGGLDGVGWSSRPMACRRRSYCSAEVDIKADDIEWYIKLTQSAPGQPLIYFPPGYKDAQETVTVVVVPPSPVDSVCRVRDFGAVGDNSTDDTAAFAKVILAPHCETIVVDPGAYLIKPLPALKNNTHLILRPGAFLQGWRDVRSYPNATKEYYAQWGQDIHDCFQITAGQPKVCRSAPLLRADHVHGITLSGGGVIDGSGPQVRCLTHSTL